MLLSSIISLLLLSGTPQESQPETVSASVYETQLHFRWNHTNYEENYLTNEDAANKLCLMLESIGMENIDSVEVVAYSSPEGVYEHNIMLSRKRARAFNSALRERLGLGGSSLKLDVRYGGEAWELLRSRIVADNVISPTARKRVLKLLDNNTIGNDTKKWRMANNYLGSTPEEGDVYHWLLRNHFRYLRCLAVTIYIHDKPDQDEDKGKETTAEGHVEEATEGHKEETVNKPVEETVTEHVEETVAEHEIEPAIPDLPVIPIIRKAKPIIGLSTNLIYDLTYLPYYGLTSIPSFSIEYYPALGHWTFGADLEWSHWLHKGEHRYNQIHNLTLWSRYYFRSGENGFRGCYVLANINGAQYGLGWDEKGWEGEGFGVSAGIGYKWTWGRFFLDIAAAGFFYSKYDPYVWGNDSTGWYYYDYTGPADEFTPRRMALTWFGPTRAYISIGFNLFNRRK